MVIAKAGRTGNCLRLRSNGKPESDGMMVILGRKTEFPVCRPVTILA